MQYHWQNRGALVLWFQVVCGQWLARLPSTTLETTHIRGLEKGCSQVSGTTEPRPQLLSAVHLCITPRCCQDSNHRRPGCMRASLAIFGAAVVEGCSCFPPSTATPAVRAAPADAMDHFTGGCPCLGILRPPGGGGVTCPQGQALVNHSPPYPPLALPLPIPSP